MIQERGALGQEPEFPETAEAGGVVLGDYVVIETGTRVDTGGTEIGDGTVVQVACRIGSGAKIGKVMRSFPRCRRRLCFLTIRRTAPSAPGLRLLQGKSFQVERSFTPTATGEPTEDESSRRARLAS